MRRHKSGRAGTSLAARLAGLEQRLEALEASAREPTDAERVEVALILLEHVYGGDTGAFAESLANHHGVVFEQAKVIAGHAGRVLEARRAAGYLT